MQKLMFIFPLILAFVMLLGITVALTRYLKKQGKSSAIITLVVVAALGLGYLLFRGIYQPYALYKSHFKEATGMTFPEEASYAFADTWVASEESAKTSSIALVELSLEERAQLVESIKREGYQQADIMPRNHPYVFKQIKHVRNYAHVSDITEGYLVEKEIEVPEDIRAIVKKLKDEKQPIPDEIKRLKKVVEQDYVRITEKDDLIKKVDYTKYFIGLLNDDKSVLVYVLHEQK